MDFISQQNPLSDQNAALGFYRVIEINGILVVHKKHKNNKEKRTNF